MIKQPFLSLLLTATVLAAGCGSDDVQVSSGPTADTSRAESATTVVLRTLTGDEESANADLSLWKGETGAPVSLIEASVGTALQEAQGPRLRTLSGSGGGTVQASATLISGQTYNINIVFANFVTAFQTQVNGSVTGQLTVSGPNEGSGQLTFNNLLVSNTYWKNYSLNGTTYFQRSNQGLTHQLDLNVFVTTDHQINPKNMKVATDYSGAGGSRTFQGEVVSTTRDGTDYSFLFVTTNQPFQFTLPTSVGQRPTWNSGQLTIQSQIGSFDVSVAGPNQLQLAFPGTSFQRQYEWYPFLLSAVP